MRRSSPSTCPSGAAKRFEQDEGVRPDSGVTALARLRPIQAGGTVTAGNASQQNDGAAACLIVAEEAAESLDLHPIAALGGWAATGCDPAPMGLVPPPAAAQPFA